MEVAAYCGRRLPAGTALFPAEAEFRGVNTLRLGCTTCAVRSGTADGARAPESRLVLSPDVWAKLAVPFDGIRLTLRAGEDGEAILGPCAAILYAGTARELGRRAAEDRIRLFFEHKQCEAGLLAIGFDESIDWDTGTMDGYVLDNRLGARDLAVPARFPIPEAIHLRWSIRKPVIEQLQERTGGRVFNWIRNMSKWQFHTLLAERPGLAEHLPETRLLGSVVDLAAMLARHETVYVKQVFGIRGIGSARVRRVPEGFELAYLDKARMAARTVAVAGELLPALREALGPGRLIVQEGLNLVGVNNRKLDFRVLLIREGADAWRCAHRHAKVAPDEHLAFTNLANGAPDADMVEALQEHYAMTLQEAEQAADQMTSLALGVAEVLSAPFHPIGIFGIDLALDVPTRRIYLLEANTVPGWGYPAAIEKDLAVSVVDYAIRLANE